MKYIKKYETIKEEQYIGKYIVFYRADKLFLGKVEGISKRVFSDYDINKYSGINKYFIHISELYPIIVALNNETTSKFYLERMNIINSFDTKEEAINFYNITKNSEKYNL